MNSSSNTDRNLRVLLPAAAFLLLFSLLRGFSPNAFGIDGRLSDLLGSVLVATGLREKPTPFIVHLDYSEPSARYFGELRPTRASLARIISAMRSAKARVIVMDTALPEPGGAWGKELAAATWPGVVVGASPLASSSVALASGPAIGEGRFASLRSAGWGTPTGFEGFAPPFEGLLSSGVGFGIMNSAPDGDGVLRRLPLVVRIGDRLFPGIALAALMKVVEVDSGEVLVDFSAGRIALGGARLLSGETKDLVLPIEKDGTAIVPFHGSWRSSFAHYEASRIVEEGEAGREGLAALRREFEGSVVIFSELVPGSGLLGALPYDAQAPRSLVLSSWLDAALRGTAPRTATPIELAVFAFAAASTLVPAGLGKRTSTAMARYLFSLTAAFAASLCFLASRIQIPLGDVLASFLASGALLGLLSIQSDAKERRRLVSRLASERRFGEIGRKAEAFGHGMKGLAELAGNYGYLIANETDELRRKELIDLQLKTIDEVASTARGIMTLLKGGEAGSKVRLPVELNNLLSGIVAMRRFQPGAFQLELFRTQAPLPVLVSPVELSRAIEALIDNAQEAMAGREGSRVIISLAVAVAGVETSIRVSDNGAGIDACKDCARDECAACRVIARGHTTKREGHGLGLFSAAALMKSLGGHFKIMSDERGTLVELRLPLLLDAWRDEGAGAEARAPLR